MLEWLDGLIPLMTLVVAGGAIAHYWRLVDLECQDDLLPDPVLLAVLQSQRPAG